MSGRPTIRVSRERYWYRTERSDMDLECPECGEVHDVWDADKAECPACGASGCKVEFTGLVWD